MIGLHGTEIVGILDRQEMKKISVIIPFYQIEKGILQRAVNSVINQQFTQELFINLIIVDDNSPIPAKEEIPQPTSSDCLEITILKKDNGGPASARNYGIDNISKDTDFVAFLDSDDSWEPHHLNTAIKALANDKDFYFSNFYQINQNVSAFDRANKINHEEHIPIPGHQSLYTYQGDMIHQIVTGNVIGTSAVVIRYNVINNLRFRESFTNAGEDYLFWIDISKNTNKIVFSTDIGFRCGEGVNVYAGAAWGTISLLERTINELHYRKTTLNELSLSLDDKKFINDKIKTLRKQIAHLIIHLLVRKKTLPLKLIHKALKADPSAIVFLPINIISSGT